MPRFAVNQFIWVAGLAGLPVPRALPIGAGSLVTFAILSSGLVIVRQAIADPSVIQLANPMLWFPAWGVALGTAVFAYALRTRRECVNSRS